MNKLHFIKGSQCNIRPLRWCPNLKNRLSFFLLNTPFRGNVLCYKVCLLSSALSIIFLIFSKETVWTPSLPLFLLLPLCHWHPAIGQAQWVDSQRPNHALRKLLTPELFDPAKSRATSYETTFTFSRSFGLNVDRERKENEPIFCLNHSFMLPDLRQKHWTRLLTV